MELRILIISIIFLFTHTALADEAADKAEFKRLYAQFNDLYANSDDLDKIIKVAERVHQFAPKVYSKRSQQYATTIYNLATLYDEKGDQFSNYSKDNRKNKKNALKLYKRYFKLLKKIKISYNRNHVYQYLNFIKTESRYYSFKSDLSYSNQLANIAKKVNLPNEELAELYYLLGQLRIQSLNMEQSRPFFQKSFDVIMENYGATHKLAGYSAHWLGRFSFGEKKYQDTKEKFEIALNSVPGTTDDEKKTRAGMYRTLSHIYLMEKQYLKSAELAVLSLNAHKESNLEYLPLIRKAPNYPKEAFVKKIEGYVLLQFNIDVKGNTKDIFIVESSNDIFNEPAIEATSHFLYAPTSNNGKVEETIAVRSKITFELANY